MAKRMGGGATPATAQNGLRSPMPWAQRRLAYRGADATRAVAERMVGAATPATAQNGLRSPMPWAQWRMASRVATSMYGSGRRTGRAVRGRGGARTSGGGAGEIGVAGV